ncbi:MAG TPA: GNAT family N-acetyltransferase [Streptosporangiaceae bacterium]
MRVFLETDRLVLRQFTAADAESLVELNSDAEVMRFISGGRATPRDEVVTRVLPGFLSYYERFAGYGFWAVIEKSSGDFLGWFHFRPPAGAADGEVELGYRLRRPAWGQGYAAEGSRALIRTGFTELGVQRVVAETLAEHAASRRVMEKAGLTLARSYGRPWPDPVTGDEHEVVQYALTRADWERHEAAGPTGTG